MTSIRKFSIKSLAVWTATFIAMSCTNLDEVVKDQVERDKFGVSQGQLNTLIGPLYGGLGNYWNTLEYLNCVTDEQLAPTRGGDWGEPEWKFMEEHTWPTNFYGFDGLWTWVYSNIAKINEKITNPGFANPETQAELRTLRAFYHYIAMDNFGNVIIATNVDSGNSGQRTRKEVYDFVEKELLESLPNLSTDVRAKYGRMSKYVAHMILAKLYLNAKVYTGEAQWQKAVDQCTAIIESGKFTISSDFLSTFSVNNENSPEIILSTPYDKSKRTGFFAPMAGLHYLHQFTYDLGSSPWNGYCTSAEFYDSFEPTDQRRNMWLTGQIYSSSGEALKDDGVPAILTKEIPAFKMNAGPVARLAGYRSVKYEVEVGANFDMSNDFVIYRISDVYLMRGEANYRLGKMPTALADINAIRSKRGVTNFSTLTDANLLAERGREMAWELHRRQDLIRFDKFTSAWQFKPVSEKYRELYPIPLNQIGLNPQLKQNTGY
ncbi:RagB/SusD family nutrient uptake outer membrane protein [Dyadobacter sp. CY312]|uniref:RagB/SusD family nutrient uptake outer membrane protein n=1 Tax=Dyadobacter sp. CY312 TaxID=2907303 RepID=UPI001F3AC7CA|nr:RagB/SusD family nutrient uptake outer membrane protein [Dyadobacter sp. CY312]MCE7040251.1 RagB/SusD family nutrient uptake outer membrane protein [Dyadobacter sp. CY312]